MPENMANMKVTVEQSSLVSPRNSSKTGSTLLSALAHFAWHIQYRTRFLFFSRPAEEWSATVKRLRGGLGEVLDYFYPVAGRLFVSEDGIMGVHYNGKGVMFIEAFANFALKDIPCKDGDFKLPLDVLMELAQTGDHVLRWPWSSDAPLFFLQATRFTCGGLCISMKFSHQLLDGTSAWHFVKSWADACCGVKISTLPTFNENPINLCKSRTDKLIIPPHLKLVRKADLLSSTLEDPESYSTECFVFDKDVIRKRKEESPGYSTFQVLTAHLWDKITAARELDENECTKLHFAVNCRQRVSSLGSGYCGQGALIVGLSTRAGNVQAEGVALLKNSIVSFTDRQVKQYSEVVEGYASSKEYSVHSDVRGENDIVVGSSFHFPVYVDFGFGKPIGMTIVPTPNDGRVYYFPGRAEGSVVAYISLKVAAMEKLKVLLTPVNS